MLKHNLMSPGLDPTRACLMVNEIDGYTVPTGPQISRPHPACWMVKETDGCGSGRARFSLQSCSHSCMLDGVRPWRAGERGLASNLVHHPASWMGSGNSCPSRPNANQTGIKQSVRPWQLLIGKEPVPERFL